MDKEAFRTLITRWLGIAGFVTRWTPNLMDDQMVTILQELIANTDLLDAIYDMFLKKGVIDKLRAVSARSAATPMTEKEAIESFKALRTTLLAQGN